LAHNYAPRLKRKRITEIRTPANSTFTPIQITFSLETLPKNIPKRKRITKFSPNDIKNNISKDIAVPNPRKNGNIPTIEAKAGDNPSTKAEKMTANLED